MMKEIYHLRTDVAHYVCLCYDVSCSALWLIHLHQLFRRVYCKSSLHSSSNKHSVVSNNLKVFHLTWAKTLSLFYFSDKQGHAPTHHLCCIKALQRLS